MRYTKFYPMKIKMESNPLEESAVLDMNSLYVRLEEMTDKWKARAIRYQLVTILVMMIMAKLGGEDTPSGIAEWVKHRSEHWWRF